MRFDGDQPEPAEVMPVWPLESPRAMGVPGSRELGLCDRMCPDHGRHCDAYGTGAESNYGHPGPHACGHCDDWRPR